MKLLILARCNSKISLFILSVLVSSNISQTQKQDVCSQRGEMCLEVNNCVNGRDVVKSGNYISCSGKNFVPGICCKNAVNPVSTTRSPLTRVNISTSLSASPLVKGPPIPSKQPPTAVTPPRRTPSTPRQQTTPRRPQQTARPNSTAMPPRTSRNSTAVALDNCQKYAQYKYVTGWKDPDLPGQMRIPYMEPDCEVVQTLIANGQPVLPKEYPHMALLGFGKLFQNVKWYCGGSLISENFILSAAHCGPTSQYGAPKWALLGDLNIATNTDDALPAVYSILRVYDHPNYNNKILVHDIALFRLNTTVKLGPYVRPACLYTSTFHPVGTKASITGWGQTDASAAIRSNHLLRAIISVTEDMNCTNRFDGYNMNTMICAADLVTGKDTCPGDSGGPLQVLNGEACMWDVIGITSYGAGICGNYEDPSVFTNVAVYLDWIQNIVWP